MNRGSKFPSIFCVSYTVRVDYLESTFNKHGDIVITQKTLPNSVHEFEERLGASLVSWRAQKIKLVWLSLPSEKSEFIPFALSQQFMFHHCFAKQITLVCPLVENAFVPPFATHTAGAGGIVISPNNDILVVRETLDERRGVFKFPGGMLDPGEHLEKAVVREVFEETGIQSNLESVISFGQVHDYQFSQSNFYFVCLLRPVTFDIVIDGLEIAEAKWMPVADFLRSKQSGTFEKKLLSKVLNKQGLTMASADEFGFENSRLEIYLP
jgi:8-oxo-dGTP diphosphatase